MNNGKRIVCLLAGTFMLLFLGLIYAWSIFRDPLAARYQAWTATQISGTFTISIVSFCVGGFVAGKLAATIRHRTIIRISAAVILVGFLSIALLLKPSAPDRSLWALYIFYGVFGGGGVGLAYNTLLGAVTRWFPGRTGMASGVLLLGFGVGGLALGSFVNALMQRIGVERVFLVLGILLAAALCLGSFFVGIPASSRTSDHASGSGAASLAAKAGVPAGSGAAPEGLPCYTLGEAVAKPTFWILCLWNIFMCVGGLLVINSAAPIAVRYGMFAVIGLIVPLFNGVGRPLIGMLLDVAGRKKAMAANTLLMLLGGVSLLLGALTENALFIYVGFPLIGVAYGGTPTLFSAVINNFYGAKHYQVILGTAILSLAVAGAAGPLLSGALQELSGGAYLTSFVMIIVAALVALILNLFLTVSGKRDGLEK
ncbi:MAG: MFS transporter [Clostridiales Family XIII bacterium]|nr:MFS transporter [Clostridiales Family XIII bacterium]